VCMDRKVRIIWRATGTCGEYSRMFDSTVGVGTGHLVLESGQLVWCHELLVFGAPVVSPPAEIVQGYLEVPVPSEVVQVQGLHCRFSHSWRWNRNCRDCIHWRWNRNDW
jgi:hypothetical protein